MGEELHVAHALLTKQRVLELENPVEPFAFFVRNASFDDRLVGEAPLAALLLRLEHDRIEPDLGPEGVAQAVEQEGLEGGRLGLLEQAIDARPNRPRFRDARVALGAPGLERRPLVLKLLVKRVRVGGDPEAVREAKNEREPEQDAGGPEEDRALAKDPPLPVRARE